MDKAHKPRDSECSTPTPEPFRMYSLWNFCPSVSKLEWNKALIIWTRTDRLPCEDDIQTGIHTTIKSGNEKGMRADSWQGVSPLSIAFSGLSVSNRSSQYWQQVSSRENAYELHVGGTPLWSSGQSSWLQIRGCIAFPVRYELNLYMLCRRK
jgi:hypothetical protein